MASATNCRLGVSWSSTDTCKSPWGVKIDPDLGQLQFVAAPGQARRLEPAGQLRQGRQGLVLSQEAIHFVVGQPAAHLDEAGHDVPVQHLGLRAQGHHKAQGPALLVRQEAEEVFGDLLRQHGQTPLRQIDGGGPFLGFPVQWGVGEDQGRDVGDVDAQAPAFRRLLQAEGVVEIPGAFTIDGDEFQTGQVLAPGRIRVGRGRAAPAAGSAPESRRQTPGALPGGGGPGLHLPERPPGAPAGGKGRPRSSRRALSR